MPPRHDIWGRGRGRGQGQGQQPTEELGNAPEVGQGAGTSVQQETEDRLSAVAPAPQVTGAEGVPPAAPAVQPPPVVLDEGVIRQIATVIATRMEAARPQPQQPPPPAQTRASNVKEFRKMNPPTYDGVADPEVAEQFLDDCEKILEVLEIEEPGTRITLTAFQLAGRASSWWKSLKGTGGHVGLSWEQFKGIFRDHFLPQSLRDAKRDEFNELMQGDLPVLEYERKFSDLSKYAPELILTPRLKCRKFVRGLRTGLRNRMLMLRINDFAELVDRAIEIERDLEETRTVGGGRKEKSSGNQQEGESKKRRKGSIPVASQELHARSSIANPGPPRRVSPAFPGQVICYHCKQPGHKKPECPQLQGASETTSRPGSVVTARDTRRCYRCGQEGHIHRHCPQLQREGGERMGQVSRSFQGSHAPTSQPLASLQGPPAGSSQSGAPQLQRGAPAGQTGGAGQLLVSSKV